MGGNTKGEHPRDAVVHAAVDDAEYHDETHVVTVADADEEVRLFYDRHPYPPPVSDLDASTTRAIADWVYRRLGTGDEAKQGL